MSYDLSISVKVDGIDFFAQVVEPEYSSPTYNLSEMFRKCMDWDFEQFKYYNCEKVIGKIENGIRELWVDPYKYTQYEPENGWGSVYIARDVLESLRDCIYKNVEYTPLEHLWVKW